MVFILPVFHFFSSTVHVVVAPALGVTVEVTNCRKARVWDMYGIKGQWAIVRAVDVEEPQLCVLQLGPNHLVLSTLHVDSLLTGVYVIPDKCQYSAFSSVYSVRSEALVASHFECFSTLQMGFLKATDVDMFLMKQMFQLCFFVCDSFCIPMHNHEGLLLGRC